jgi:hypothetical protein
VLGERFRALALDCAHGIAHAGRAKEGCRGHARSRSRGSRGDLLPTHQHRWLEVDEDNARYAADTMRRPANQALPLLVNGARAKRGVRRAAKTAGKPKT